MTKISEAQVKTIDYTMKIEPLGDINIIYRIDEDKMWISNITVEINLRIKKKIYEDASREALRSMVFWGSPKSSEDNPDKIVLSFKTIEEVKRFFTAIYYLGTYFSKTDARFKYRKTFKALFESLAI